MLKGACNRNHLTILLANTDGLTRLDDVGRNVENLAVNDDVLMRDELTSRGTRRRKTEAIDNIVKTGLAELKKNITRLTLLDLSALEEDAELLLAHSVDVLRLLLLEKLLAILGDLALTLGTMLPRRIGTLDFLFTAENRLAETTGNL